MRKINEDFIAEWEENEKKKVVELSLAAKHKINNGVRVDIKDFFPELQAVNPNEFEISNCSIHGSLLSQIFLSPLTIFDIHAYKTKKLFFLNNGITPEEAKELVDMGLVFPLCNMGFRRYKELSYLKDLINTRTPSALRYRAYFETVYSDASSHEKAAEEIFHDSDLKKWDTVYRGGAEAYRHAIERRYSRIACLYPDIAKYIKNNPSPELVDYFDILLIDPITESLGGIFKFDPSQLPRIKNAPMFYIADNLVKVPFDLLQSLVELFQLDLGPVSDTAKKAAIWEGKGFRKEFDDLLKKLNRSLRNKNHDSSKKSAENIKILLQDVHKWIHDRTSQKKKIEKNIRWVSIGAVGIVLSLLYSTKLSSVSDLAIIATLTNFGRLALQELIIENLSEKITSIATPAHITLLIDFKEKLIREGVVK